MLLQGDPDKEQAACEYAQEKGVEIDKGGSCD
jgi:hypothetical protein